MLEQLVDAGFGRTNVEFHADGTLIVSGEPAVLDAASSLVSEQQPVQASNPPFGVCTLYDDVSNPSGSCGQTQWGCWCDHWCVMFNDCCPGGPC